MVLIERGRRPSQIVGAAKTRRMTRRMTAVNGFGFMVAFAQAAYNAYLGTGRLDDSISWKETQKFQYHNKIAPEESVDTCNKVLIILGELWTAWLFTKVCKGVAWKMSMIELTLGLTVQHYNTIPWRRHLEDAIRSLNDCLCQY